MKGLWLQARHCTDTLKIPPGCSKPRWRQLAPAAKRDGGEHELYLFFLSVSLIEGGGPSWHRRAGVDAPHPNVEILYTVPRDPIRVRFRELRVKELRARVRVSTG